MREPIVSTHREVASALADGAPIVALESTIITHGMPYPDNVETALAEVAERGIAGKEVTPVLLAHIVDLTGRDSLAANVALVLNNARVAAAIATA